MENAVPLSLNFGTNRTISFDFSKMFTDRNRLTELHNHNSMVICGDCLTVLNKIKDNSVKLIFADAPYNIGKDFGNPIY